MERVYDHKTELKINQEFSRLNDECYLDHAGTTLYSETQIKNIFNDFSKNVYGNPHSLSQCSKNCGSIVDQIRLRILDQFHTTPGEYSVIFTSGTTASIKLLLENFDWKGENTSFNEEGFDDSSSPFSQKDDQEGSAYVYTQNSHTSVVGGREIARAKGVPFFCLQQEKLFSIMSDPIKSQHEHCIKNSLFVYPAQCNFSGRKYPLEWITKVHQGVLDSYDLPAKRRRNSKWFCLLDAAAYCSTNELNLSLIHPDFVCISFYKIFGYPTGLGALLVRNSSSYVLNKTYFGGGTVLISLPNQPFHKLRPILHERFEDGTIPFLSIISLQHGFNTLTRLNLNMNIISHHVFNLAKYAVGKLTTLQHWNGMKAVELYADTDYTDFHQQGGIVNFNLKRSDGQYIGFVEVLQIANLHKIQFRTGCFCNTGACQTHLKLTDQEMKLYFEAGHVCGDKKDLINGMPTGSIRISFGYMSTAYDVERLIDVLNKSFVESSASLYGIPATVKRGGSKITLKKIFTYPIKSCGAMEVTSWRLNEKGLEYDREWMIVDENGVYLTQKAEPKLSLIQPYLNFEERKLILSFKKGGVATSVRLDDEEERNSFQSNVCGDRINTYDCGDEVSFWLCHRLNREGLRLVRQSKDITRMSKIRGSQGSATLSLSNQAQFLLINDESVRWLQGKIDPDDDFDSSTLADRFRGNFLIDGAELFSETNWKHIAIGDITFQVDGPCTRCQIICIDQHTGEKNRKPLVALSRALNGKLRFGVYLHHVNLSHNPVLHVGDTVWASTSE